MKIILLTLILIFSTINIYADKNWIQIEPKSKVDVNLSQIQPINKMIKNATDFKQLIDVMIKNEKVDTNEKNWFILNSENTK